MKRDQIKKVIVLRDTGQKLSCNSKGKPPKYSKDAYNDHTAQDVFQFHSTPINFSTYMILCFQYIILKWYGFEGTIKIILYPTPPPWEGTSH